MWQTGAGARVLAVGVQRRGEPVQLGVDTDVAIAMCQDQFHLEMNDDCDRVDAETVLSYAQRK